MLDPKKHNTFCHYPFKAMTFKKWSTDGRRPTNVTPCCMMMNPVEQESGPDKHYNMGLVSNVIAGKNPLEIFNSPQYEKLRNDLTNGIKNEACSVCWKMEENGLQSFRQCSDLYGGTEGLFEFDITLSNLCNLACRMCNVGSSHQWGKDVDAMVKNGTHDAFQIASDRAAPVEKGVIYDKESNEVIDWLMNNTHQITMLKASGGEPFYDRRVVKVLEKYVKDGTAKNTILKFHTNATQFTPEIADMLNNFKEQGHTFSIDGTRKTYNYIRHHSDWGDLNDSLDCYLKRCKNIRHQYFNMVLSGINVLNAADYIEWICYKCYNHGTPDWYIHFAEMFPYNRGTSLRNLPKELLEEALDRILDVLDIAFVSESNTIQATIRGKVYKKWYRFNINNIANQIQNAIDNNVGDYKKFKAEVVLLDNVRNQSYRDYVDPLLTKHLDTV